MGSIQQFIANLQPMMPLVLAGTVIAILVVILVILMIFRSAGKKSPEEETVPEEMAPETPEAVLPAAPVAKLSGLKLRRSFSKAVRALKEKVSGPNFRYQVPWVLMLGESGSGKTRALDTSGLNLSMDHPFGKGTEVKQPCNWWFFEKGVVLDIAGDLVLREDGHSSNERLWKLLLRLLQKHRMARPIDGAVITIPCTDLLTPDGKPVPDMTRIAEKADLLYQKIWEAQKILGMSFPVYVMVTKCDRIEGFKSFCREVPGRFKGEIFGWSSPYGTGTAYAEEWTGEAFRDVNRELSLLQYELFTRGTNVSESDGLFLFADNIQSLKEPLQVFLDHLFKQGAYHETFAPRGIYFSGADEPAAKEQNTFFARNLFEKKVFPESGLARPVAKTLLTRNRKVLALQVTVLLITLIGIFGLWRSYSLLDADINQAMPVFKKVVDDAGELGRAYDITRSDVLYTLLRKKSPFSESAEYLLENMGKISTYRSLFIPTSWFSDINQNNTKAMILAFEEIILKGLYFQLNQKAKEIFTKAERGIASEEGAVAANGVAEMSEFLTLQVFVRELRELEDHIRIYNDIRKSETVKPLGDLAAYVFGITLGESFYTDSETYLNALRRSKYKVFDPRIFRLKTRFFTLKKLTDRLYRKLFDDHDIHSYLAALKMQLDGFSQDQRSAEKDGELIHTLLETFDRTEQILQEKRYAYVFRSAFDLGEPFVELLDKLGRLEFIGDKLISEIRTNGETAFLKLQTQIKQSKTSLTGYLVDRQNDYIQRQLSQRAIRLRDDLALLLDQEFMVFEMTPGWEVQADATENHRWDVPILEEVVTLFEPYDGFLNKGLDNIPPELQHIIVRLAQNGMENKLMDNLGKAWKEMPTRLQRNGQRKESELLSAIKNFREASAHLVRLLEYFNQLDLMDSQHLLTEILYRQVASMFHTVDDFLDTENLYMIKGGNLSWWDGKEKLSLAAFDSVDEKELENHLKLQRKRVEHLALAFAEPLAEFASDSGILNNREEEQILFKWQRIIDELNKYNNKKPENSITVLEKFVRFEMDKISPENYLKEISLKDLEHRSGDLFLRKRDELRRLLYKQSEMLASRKVQNLYRVLSEDFNTRLAGRFPFAPLTGQKVYTEVTPDDIRGFFKLYDGQAGTLKELLGKSRLFGTSGDEAVAFLNQMGTVRHLFAAFIDGTKESGKFPVFATFTDDEGNVKENEPSFDFDIEFRVNRSYEIGGNRIIEWQFKAGNQSHRYNEEKRLGRWRYGDPITVTLRWAKDSISSPFFAGDQAGVRIEDKTVTFLFENQWALIRLLAFHAASAEDFAELADPKPHTLKFLVRTRTAEDNADTAYENLPETRVFMRMVILTPGKKKQVLVMPYFPIKAPELEPVSTKDQASHEMMEEFSTGKQS